MVEETLLTQNDEACRFSCRNDDARDEVALFAVPYTFVLQPRISNTQLPS
jgi:hypothetical protein